MSFHRKDTRYIPLETLPTYLLALHTSPLALKVQTPQPYLRIALLSPGEEIHYAYVLSTVLRKM